MKSFLIINQVKQRLETSTKMRDDDALLMADIWREQLEQMGAKSMYDVLNAIAGRMVTSPESIRRSRQKVQQDYPNLRGTVYNQRHAKEIEVLKTDVRLHQEFFIKEYKLHLSCIEKKETISLEPAIKRYSVHLNKVQPFYTGLI